MADQISDAILDAMIKDDPGSRVAVETMITTGQVHVAGEVTTQTYVDIPGIIRDKILEIGYDSSAKGYDGASCGVSVSIGSQSPDIAQGVNDAFEYREGEGTDELDRQGAGDQGLMFGCACRETRERMGEAGLTGRKIIMDTDGAMAGHGGGAFSGKDPSKVDRRAAYAKRWVAKNVVAAGLADRCEAQVAYAIGKAMPVGLFIECFGTETGPVGRIQDAVMHVFDLRPRAIIYALDLLRPLYAQTAAYGHFGRTEPDFSWERTDRAGQLRDAVGV